MDTKFTSTQWITAFLIVAVYIFISTELSIQAPFYPAEANGWPIFTSKSPHWAITSPSIINAERKGASATEYGLVFSSFQIVNFIACPLVGKIVKTYGPRRLIAGGVMTGSIAMMLFGSLNRVENKNLFISLSIILRVIEAIGSAFANVAGFSLLGIVFPDNIATVFGTLEIFFGAGLILGPSVGGLLFEFGGFPFPFIFAGVVGLIVFFLTLLLIPPTTDCSSEEIETYEVLSALKISGVLFYAICQVLTSASEGFYLTLLATHLGQFDLSPEMISLCFVIISAFYTFTSPFFGRALDSGSVRPSTLIICASIFGIIGFTLIGPAPYLHFQLTFPICVIALVMLGLSLGANNATSYTGQLESAKKAGLADEQSLTALISGIWIGAISFGGFIGPMIAGILYDHYGFRWATQFFVAAFIIQIIGMIIFERNTKCNVGNEYNLLISGIDECTPILKNTSS